MKQFSECVVLIVDDTKANIDLLLEGLASEPYQLAVAINGPTALEYVNMNPPDLILMDVMMPGMTGYEVCQELKNNPATSGIPVVFLTTLAKTANIAEGFRYGGVDYVTKPVEIIEVRARVRVHLELSLARQALQSQNSKLEELVDERTHELTLTQEVTIRSLASLAETRDNETGGHIRRTQSYVRALAEALSEFPQYSEYHSEEAIRLLFKSAPLHDIGKVGVPDSILLKPGKLTKEEFDQMKLHTVYGRDALAQAQGELVSSSFLELASEIAYTHHEKWNGKGYPEGLAGEEIPLSGRLMAIADVYDALISERVYKDPFPHSKALQIILSERGEHFDPGLVDVFEGISETFREIALSFADSQKQRDTLMK